MVVYILVYDILLSKLPCLLCGWSSYVLFVQFVYSTSTTTITTTTTTTTITTIHHTTIIKRLLLPVAPEV